MAGDWQKKYRWQRTWGDETGIDGKKHEDYAAYDGDQYAGRIRLDLESLKNGQWFWAEAHPKTTRGSPLSRASLRVERACVGIHHHYSVKYLD